MFQHIQNYNQRLRDYLKNSALWLFGPQTLQFGPCLYKGTLNWAYQRHGQGTLTCPDGYSYTGE